MSKLESVQAGTGSGKAQNHDYIRQLMCIIYRIETMKKKLYIIPGITTTAVELQQMIAFSGGDSNTGGTGITIDNNTPDDGSDKQRSRRVHNVWGDEEEEELF